jgi:hypothetical protein
MMAGTNEVKHTPGPWKVGKFLRISGGEPDVHGGRMLIASVNGGRVGGGDGEANATLIAESPNMLAALKMAEEFVLPVEGSQLIWEHIRKVIRKAGT